MIDLSKTIIPKSDQLNADQLIGSTLVITITKVSEDQSNVDQPTIIHYQNDNGRPYKPCKGMRRVLVNAWGKDGSKYIGRSMRLFRNPGVLFGGQAVGGIQIAELSDIDGPITMALTVNRASRKPFTVKPLVVSETTSAPSDGQVALLFEHYKSVSTTELFDSAEKQRAALWPSLNPEQRKLLKDGSESAKARLAASSQPQSEETL